MKFFFRFLIGIGLNLLTILHFDFLRELHSSIESSISENHKIFYRLHKGTPEEVRKLSGVPLYIKIIALFVA